mgnify:CR=1 FL=1
MSCSGLLHPCAVQAPFQTRNTNPMALQSGRLGVRSTSFGHQHYSVPRPINLAAPVAQRASPIVRASGDRGPGAFGNDGNSDVVFVAKLAAVSFGGEQCAWCCVGRRL